MTPETDDPGPPSLTSISSGTLLTCGIGPAGWGYCWGASGTIGDGTMTERLRPAHVLMPDGVQFTRISAGGAHACAVHAGDAYCWGNNGDGQLGDGTSSARLAPVAVSTEAAVDFDSITAGEFHTCARTSIGAAHCWGDNAFGQLGDGSVSDRPTHTAVATPGSVSFISLDAGWVHTCGLAVGGAAYCWGNNADGQLGDGTNTDRLTATPATMPAGIAFSVIAVGDIHTCALSTQGAAYCWGAAHRGRLGDGSTVPRSTPGPVSMPSGVVFTTLGAGYAHTCALTSTGLVFCWGRNVFGEIGDGTGTERPTPTLVSVPAGVTFTRLAVGRSHSCALTQAGEVFCWGINLDGQIGDGTTDHRLAPVRVVPR